MSDQEDWLISLLENLNSSVVESNEKPSTSAECQNSVSSATKVLNPNPNPISRGKNPLLLSTNVESAALKRGWWTCRITSICEQTPLNTGDGGAISRAATKANLKRCKYCEQHVPEEFSEQHELICEQNLSIIGEGGGVISGSATKAKSKRCKYCKQHVPEEFSEQHEFDCYMNPVNIVRKEEAKQREMEDVVNAFRRAPNPEPASWQHIPERSSRSAERRSERYGFVPGIGMDSLSIPCEFCLDVLPAQYIYEHERNCDCNPTNAGRMDVASGWSSSSNAARY